MTPRRAAAVAMAFGALGLGAGALLRRDPPQPPSPWIGRPAPPLAGPTLHDPTQRFDSASLRGRPWMLNVWASWCAPCIEEHPLFVDLQRRTGALIVGLNHADERNAAIGWLKLRGNPFAATLHDDDGALAAAWGVQGLPQTFVIDGAGIVRAHHVGRLSARAMAGTMEPLMIPSKS